MALELYRKKRNFAITPEPKGGTRPKAGAGLSFVIQKHRASHMHYDFRLELDGVLLSWAVPKGPSLDPADKRLAMHTEDHPIEYGGFEGVIPPKQYGAGTVLLWDRGVWIPEGDPAASYRKGKLKFRLEGEKLRGNWTLVRGWASKERDDKAWFLIKIADEEARQGDAAHIVDTAPLSVASGRDLDEIAADPDRVWHSNKTVAENVRGGAVKRKARAIDLASVPGARKAKLPAELVPQLATLVKEPPVGDDWVHEIKYDGYRMVCRIADGQTQMISRNGKDWTAQFGPIARALARLPVREAWVDGEVVVLDADGRTSFQALQNALGSGDTSHMVFWLFDLVHLDGYDLSGATLLDRKAVLKRLLDKPPALLRYSDHFEGSGAEVLSQACRLKLEGIVSKRRQARYRAGRGAEWVKVKCALRQELVIGGYTDPSGARTGFGALLLGVYDRSGALRYCGKVGTGFNEETLSTLAPRLRKMEQSRPAFVNPPRGYDAKGAHWIAPELVGEVAFTEWTRDGTVRHPSFQGLRADKNPREVVLELPQDAPAGEAAAAVEAPEEAPPAVVRKATKSARKATGKTAAKRAAPAKGSAPAARKGAAASPNTIAGVALSNPDKVLYPEEGITKRDLACFYDAIGELMVPHFRDRPLTLLRCPNGWDKPCFYQKHVREAPLAFIEPIAVPEGDGTATYMMANSVSAIVALLQMGALELHPWGSRRPHLDKPDRLVFDFDPDEDLGWDRLVEAVGLLRTLLENIGLVGFLKTTGGKGLHVVVPVRPEHGWETIRAFSKAVADLLVEAVPGKFTSNLSKAHRGGKIFVDYLRNAEGATAVGTYSVRAKAGASVSTPIAWEELKDDVRFAHFNIRNVPKRLARGSDPWRDFEAAGDQRVTAAMLRRLGLKSR